MKERYTYDLGFGPKEYELEVIADRLYVDCDFLQQIVDYEDSEINSAVMKATREKVLSEKFDFLRKNFSASFLIDENPKAILTSYYSMNGRKRAFLRSLEDSLEQEQSGYYTFSSDTLNLIAVNSVSNFEKHDYSTDEVCDFESLKSIADGDFKTADISNYHDLLGSPLTEKEIEISGEIGALALTYEHTKYLVDFVKEHRLPMIYNQYIFKDVNREEVKGKCYVAHLNPQK
ncbi:MAG: hypothetical protein IJ193_06435 [Bacilli bacterium]|nr:hypothetical protein [Bacilli bacterium]